MTSVEGVDGLYYDSDTRAVVEPWLRENVSPLKQWFKAREVSQKLARDSVAEYRPSEIGRALSAIYHDPESELIVERRSATAGFAYRVRRGV